eukprot:6214095-Pleurochrysis_carterae.AAC.1
MSRVCILVVCLSVIYVVAYIHSVFALGSPNDLRRDTSTHARYGATPSAGRRPACTPRLWKASPPASQHTRIQYESPRVVDHRNAQAGATHAFQMIDGCVIVLRRQRRETVTNYFDSLLARPGSDHRQKRGRVKASVIQMCASYNVNISNAYALQNPK